MTILWTWPLRMWEFSIGEARYYGWRFMISIGPLNLWIGYAKP